MAREVAETCDETVHIAILEDLDVIHIAKVDSTRAVRMVSAAGPPTARPLHRRPARCSSRRCPRTSSTPRADGRELAAMTPRSITDPDALRAELAAVRERGTAFEHRESDPDVHGVAAPVRDGTGQVVAALSVSVPVIRWSEEREAELAELAAKGADDLSARPATGTPGDPRPARSPPPTRPHATPSYGLPSGQPPCGTPAVRDASVRDAAAPGSAPRAPTGRPPARRRRAAAGARGAVREARAAARRRLLRSSAISNSRRRSTGCSRTHHRRDTGTEQRDDAQGEAARGHTRR